MRFASMTKEYNTFKKDDFFSYPHPFWHNHWFLLCEIKKKSPPILQKICP